MRPAQDATGAMNRAAPDRWQEGPGAWPDTKDAKRNDLQRLVDRHSGRRSGDVFDTIDECIDLQIELGLWRPEARTNVIRNG
jgi:hypothetical protein